MKTLFSVMSLVVAASALSFVPACTEVHNEAPARGSYEQRDSTHREETTYSAPGATITREHQEEIRR
jgi:hypothetical protein